MAGFEGKMLEVDLTTGEIGSSTVDKDVLRKFIGGSGLAAKLFLDRVSPDVDPLSPDNQLFIMTGPLSGNTIPGGARFSVGTKSPLTNMWGESCSGGNFASELRGAGWDGIILQGASSKPVYMVIEDGKVEIKDASDLWGKGNYEVTDILKERHGGKKAKVLAIGQAGENLVRYAGICNEKRDYAARCGLGAVMGSKKLKAVVVKGTGKIELADPTRFASRRKKILETTKDHIVAQVLGSGGTAGSTDFGVYLGDVPGKNWMIEDNIPIASKLGGAVLNSPEYLTGTESCHGCSIGCKRVIHITKGPYAGMAGPGPEYE
ncbi:MAG: aldehyde ferredoxin oxidoreductase, partial [Chloroflexi bacterium]|nr:aldehyde ferredoxin oxidoreductase [Chloroflexota bacterium]